jgi:hypothetical protein
VAVERGAKLPQPEAFPAPVDLGGLWQDTTWGHTSRIVQLGDSFRFTTQGMGCQGPFRSVGVGTIRGTRVESTYESTMPSRGRCWGTVAPDGTTRLTCVDSVCGEFTSSAVRQ